MGRVFFVVFLLLFSPFLGFASHTNVFVSTDPNSNLQGDGLSMKPGYGYSHDNQEELTPPCINSGPIDYSGTPFAFLDLARQTDLKIVQEQLNIKVGTEFKIGMFENNLSGEFARYTEDDDYADSLIYRARYEFLDSRYTLPEGNILNAKGENLIDDPDRFRQYCGDAYINKVEHGANLYVVFQMHFLTHKDEQLFKAKYVGKLASFGFTAEFADEVKNSNIQGSIHVFALQSGGEVQDLSKIFGESDPGKPEYDITSCSFANLKACEGVMNGVIHYAASSDGFPGQMKPLPGEEIPPHAAITGFKAEEYSAIVKISTKSKLTQAIRDARRQIGNALEETNHDLQRTDYLRDVTVDQPYLYRNYKDQLSGVIANLQDNASALRITGLSCFEELDTCVEKATVTLAELKPIDKAVLTLPETYEITSQDPNGVDNVQKFVAENIGTPLNGKFFGMEVSVAGEPVAHLESEVTITTDGPNIDMLQLDALTHGIIAEYHGGYEGIIDGHKVYKGEVTYRSTGKRFSWQATLEEYK